jgi:phosphatidylglycerophosphate synthase
MVAIFEEFGHLLSTPITTSLRVVSLAFVLLTVGLTLWSGISYFAKNWDLVSDS